MNVSSLRSAHVSYSVLSSIPWSGTSRLVSIMDQVLQRGPNDQKTWSSLLRRADLILDSFSTNNLSRMAVLLTKNSSTDTEFLQKIKSQCLKRANQSDLLSCCGFLYALNKMGVCDEQVLSAFRQRVIDQLSSAKHSYPLLLILNVYCSHKHKPMATTLLTELKKHVDSMGPKCFAMAITDTLSNFDDTEVYAHLNPFIINSLTCLQSMDTRSLVRLYSVFCSTSHPLRHEYLVNLASTLNNSVQHATLHQLSTVLKGYTRSKVDTNLLRGVLDSIKSKYKSGELQELIFVLSNLLKLNLTEIELVEGLMNQIVKFKNINGIQLSNLVYLSGKHRLNIPEWFILENYERQKDSFTLRELALFAYGMDKLGNSSLHTELQERAKSLIGSGASNEAVADKYAEKAANNGQVANSTSSNYNTTSHIILKQIFKNLN